MKTVFSLLSISLLLAGCSASVDGGPAAAFDDLMKPLPTATPQPQSCTNYAGTYQMNSDYFRIEQTDCSKVTMVSLPTAAKPTEAREVYLADGKPHTVSGKEITASWDSKGYLNLASKLATGEAVLKIYSYQRKPCNLGNPDSSQYLTRDVFINKVWNFDYCAFWSRQ